MMVGLLGVLKAGGAYMPLDPDLPGGRLAVLLDEARIGVVLAQERLPSTLPPCEAEVLTLEDGAGDDVSARRTREAGVAWPAPSEPGVRDLHLGLDR